MTRGSGMQHSRRWLSLACRTYILKLNSGIDKQVSHVRLVSDSAAEARSSEQNKAVQTGPCGRPACFPVEPGLS